MQAHRRPALWSAAFLFVFGSAVYGLLLAQTEAALTHFVVLPFCFSISLYAFFLGMGMVSSGQKTACCDIRKILTAFVILVFSGSLPVIFLKISAFWGISRIIFICLSYLCIAVAGYVSGKGFSAFINIVRGQDEKDVPRLLGVGACGILSGMLCFAFFFFPRLGLLRASLLAAFITAGASILLTSQYHLVAPEKRAETDGFVFLHFGIFILSGVLFFLI